LRLTPTCVLPIRTRTTPSMMRSPKRKFSPMCLNGRELVGELANRRKKTAERFAALRHLLSSAETLAHGKACVFATGSFGRGEASRYSDLDVFIVGRNSREPESDDATASQLKNLDAICIKAKLIEATRKLYIPEFSGDGRYLTHYSVYELTKTLGTEHDDVTNTFTARLLLLLESQPLLEARAHKAIKREVIDAYWRDYKGRERVFNPAFLANDILRLWRTFCVNYEARTERAPRKERAKGKLKNYKLKHSRLLTCYSGLIYLLAVYEGKGTVSPEDAMTMTELTPTGRLDWLLGRPKFSTAGSKIVALLNQYEQFLKITDAADGALISEFMSPTTSRSRMAEAYKFGDLVYDALNTVGNGNKLHRILLV
ncbi:MAG: nucleotidyltransferase domain-containing protein, partial [Candidatus Micrarchaeaceae archaeon]